jgi:hypothetical protein
MSRVPAQRVSMVVALGRPRAASWRRWHRVRAEMRTVVMARGPSRSRSTNTSHVVPSLQRERRARWAPRCSGELRRQRIRQRSAFSRCSTMSKGLSSLPRRGGRAVECGGLEIVMACSMGAYRHAGLARALYRTARTGTQWHRCWCQDWHQDGIAVGEGLLLMGLIALARVA